MTPCESKIAPLGKLPKLLTFILVFCEAAIVFLEKNKGLQGTEV